MIMLSIGPFDQVIGIQDNTERAIVIRTGVSSSDLSGKTWKIISAGISHGHEHLSSGIKPNYMQLADSGDQFEETIDTNKEDTKSNIAHGSSNDNFKKTANEFGNRASRAVASSVARTAMQATVGRIPVAGKYVNVI